MAGVIVFLLGLVGLLELYGRGVIPVNLAVVSTYLTFTGALVLFGAIAIIGLGLIIGGLATLGEEEPTKVVVERPAQPAVVPPVVVVTQPAVMSQPVIAPPAQGATPRVVTAYAAPSDLEISVLRYLSQGKKADEIAQRTGVSDAAISEKMTKLYTEGYTTEQHALTEKGFEALRLADSQRVYVQASA